MATGVLARELQEYFNRADSWDRTEAERARKERRNAYMVAAAGAALGLGATVLYLVSPLRIVEPYVIRVDQRAGAVDVVSVARNTKVITGDEAVRKYFLAEYVRSREAWIPKARDELYQKAASLTGTNELGRLRAERDPSNANSPVNLYRNGETASVEIRGIAFISENVGQVRFSRVVEGSGSNPVRSDWVATIQFDFAERPTNDATRFYNPLGFVVTSYRADSELAGAGR
jgi:type IV secretion system protein VirB8